MRSAAWRKWESFWKGSDGPLKGKGIGCQGARNTFNFSHALPLRGQPSSAAQHCWPLSERPRFRRRQKQHPKRKNTNRKITFCECVSVLVDYCRSEAEDGSAEKVQPQPLASVRDGRAGCFWWKSLLWDRVEVEAHLGAHCSHFGWNPIRFWRFSWRNRFVHEQGLDAVHGITPYSPWPTAFSSFLSLCCTWKAPEGYLHIPVRKSCSIPAMDTTTVDFK